MSYLQDVYEKLEKSDESPVVKNSKFWRARAKGARLVRSAKQGPLKKEPVPGEIKGKKAIRAAKRERVRQLKLQKSDIRSQKSE